MNDVESSRSVGVDDPRVGFTFGSQIGEARDALRDSFEVEESRFPGLRRGRVVDENDLAEPHHPWKLPGMSGRKGRRAG